MSNYPPGVTGFEPQIAGYPERPECDTPHGLHDERCEECGYVFPTAADYADDERDRLLDRQMMDEEEGR